MWEASGPFLPRATWMASKAPFLGKPRGAGAQQLMTVGHCEWKNRGVIVKPSLFLEGLVMANPTCRNCDRSADAGAYCSSCAAGIMAKAPSIPSSVDAGESLHVRSRPDRPFPPLNVSSSSNPPVHWEWSETPRRRFPFRKPPRWFWLGSVALGSRLGSEKRSAAIS